MRKILVILWYGLLVVTGVSVGFYAMKKLLKKGKINGNNNTYYSRNIRGY